MKNKYNKPKHSKLQLLFFDNFSLEMKAKVFEYERKEQINN